jgi:hypothetical protein
MLGPPGGGAGTYCGHGRNDRRAQVSPQAGFHAPGRQLRDLRRAVRLGPPPPASAALGKSL